MQGNERWMELCAKAAVESDPAKMLALVKEINILLEAKDRLQPQVTMRLSSDPG